MYTHIQGTKPLLSEEVLFSLCDNSDFGQYAVTHQAIHEWFLATREAGVLRRLVEHTQLNDRYPIFGRVGDVFTKNTIGFNWNKGDTKKKRVTIPAFDIGCHPIVPAKWFRQRRVDELQKVFQESVDAMNLAELEYFYSLLKTASAYSEYYPKMVLEGELTCDYLKRATAAMPMMGIEPAAIFMHSTDVEATRVAVEQTGMQLISHSGSDWDRSFYIFGKSEDLDYSTAHIIDNTSQFRVKNAPYPPNEWNEPVGLKFVENVGFLVARAGVLKITRNLKPVKPPKPSRVQAFVVGEAGEIDTAVLIEDVFYPVGWDEKTKQHAGMTVNNG
jgi:hypothetical protein